jgi:hypothetical protein
MIEIYFLKTGVIFFYVNFYSYNKDIQNETTLLFQTSVYIFLRPPRLCVKIKSNLFTFLVSKHLLLNSRPQVFPCRVKF